MPRSRFSDSRDPRQHLHEWRRRRFARATGPQRAVGAIVGLVFAGIGLTLLVSLWTRSGFGSPPVFFRLVGSGMSIIFMAAGVGAAVAALRGGSAASDEAGFDDESLSIEDDVPPTAARTAPPSPGTFSCPHCGARLAQSAEVSPHGDVKCVYCGAWFNIHSPPAPPRNPF